MPLLGLIFNRKLGDYCAVRSSRRTAFSCVTREVLKDADRMVGRIIRPCVVEEGGLTECIDHRLWCSAVHGSGAASESVRAPGLVCSGLVCSALARPADRQSLLQGVNSCKSRSHRAVVLHQPPAARGKSLDLGVSHSAVVHIACTKTLPFLKLQVKRKSTKTGSGQGNI